MSQLNIESNESLEAFSAEVEKALDSQIGTSNLWAPILAWCVDALILTLAVRADSAALYIVGVLLTIVWVIGFAYHRPNARWFSW